MQIKQYHIVKVARNISERQLEINITSNQRNFRPFVGCSILKNISNGRDVRRYSIYRIVEEELISGIDMIPTRYGILVDGKKLIASL